MPYLQKEIHGNNLDMVIHAGDFAYDLDDVSHNNVTPPLLISIFRIFNELLFVAYGAKKTELTMSQYAQCFLPQRTPNVNKRARATPDSVPRALDSLETIL